MTQTILTEVDHGVGLVTLNNPAQANALSRVALDELAIAFAAMDADAAVQVVVFSSIGERFSSGLAAYDVESLGSLEMLLRAIVQIDKPTVARVQGSAFGIAPVIIAACDIAVAVFDAKFSLASMRQSSLAPIITPYLTAAMGLRQARRYLLSAEVFSAGEAYRIGLIHEMVTDAHALDDAIGEIVASLQATDTAAHAAFKAALRKLGGGGLARA